MPISRQNEVIREITMMVRKGTIQFDMNDRPVLDLNRTDKNTGRKISYCVGSIGRDEENNGLFYTLYTTDGSFVPSVKGPRSIDSLYSKELMAVRDCVAKYFDMSISRSKNLQDILEFARAHEGGYDFEAVKPSAYVDPKLDGNLVEVNVDSIFFPDPSVHSDTGLLFSGTSADGMKVTGTVQSLNDHAITNMVTCLGLGKELTLAPELEKTSAKKSERKVNAGQSL